MAKAWWWIYGVTLVALAVLYAVHLVPRPQASWDPLGRGIVRLLASFAGLGGRALLALAATPGALAARAGQPRFVAVCAASAVAWALIAWHEA